MRVRCSVEWCAYDALGMVSGLPDFPGFLSVTVSSAPLLEEPGTVEPQGVELLCRHHLIDRVDKHSEAAAMRPALGETA